MRWPWAVCFIVRDHNVQKLAYGYFEDEPTIRQQVDHTSAIKIGPRALRPWASLFF